MFFLLWLHYFILKFHNIVLHFSKSSEILLKLLSSLDIISIFFNIFSDILKRNNDDFHTFDVRRILSGRTAIGFVLLVWA